MKEIGDEVLEAQIDEWRNHTCKGCDDIECPNRTEDVKECMENR